MLENYCTSESFIIQDFVAGYGEEKMYLCREGNTQT